MSLRTPLYKEEIHGKSSHPFNYPVESKIDILRPVVKFEAGVLVYVLTGLVLFFSDCRTLQSYRTGSAIEEIMNRNKVIGLSVVVTGRDRILFSAGYGYSSRERRMRTSSSTVYRLASISKTVTSTAVMQLVEQGRLSLDSDVSNYLSFRLRNPRFPNLPVTIRHLLTHTSGLKDTSRYSDPDCENNCDDFLWKSQSETPPALAEIFVRGGSFNTQDLWSADMPGSKFQYSNLASGLLASIVETVSGERFDNFCEKNIFRPLQMKAAFNSVRFAERDNVAVLYRFRKARNIFEAAVEPLVPARLAAYPFSGPTRGFNGIIFSPQGGLRASVTDLSRFMMAHMNDGVFLNSSILGREAAQYMRETAWTGNELDGFYKNYGINFHITNDLISGKTMIGHRGEAYGLLADMYFDRDRKFGIIIAMNGGDYRKGSGAFYDVEVDLFRYLYETYAVNL